MSQTITEAFVQSFRSNVMHLSQQKGSRLRVGCRIEDNVVGQKHFFERLAPTAAVKRTSRHSDTPLVEQTHSRRMVTLPYFDWADLVDQPDKLKTIINADSEYAMNAANAMGRAIDDEIIAALGGNAYSGADGTTAVPLPSDQKVAVGTSDLSLAKVLEAKKILDSAEVDEEDRFIAVTADQVEAMLNTSEVKSSDYNTVKALVQGEINTFLGFTWIRSQRLVRTGDVRYCYAWARRGMGLAMAQEVVTRIEPRPDKNYSVQVYLGMSGSSTRIEDEAVVEIACDETAA